MSVTAGRLALGFAAGALAHLVFQGGLGAVLYAADLRPDLVWSLKPVPPFGVPITLNNMFWDGLWGIVYALIEPRLTARLGRWPGGLVFSIAPLSVFWFVVLPLKGSGIGGGFDATHVPAQVALDAAFGLGTAVIFALGLARHRGARHSERHAS